MKHFSFIYFIILLGVSYQSISQSDSLNSIGSKKKKIYGEARKATIMSAIIPGAGQIYNKKYWKAPIIYAGLGGFGYLLATNQTEFLYYSKNLKYEYDNNPATENKSGYSGEQLQELKVTYRKRRDLGIIGCAIIYALNILDANVDAHLKTFDISDDLSIRIEPQNNLNFINNKYYLQTGLAIHINIH